MMSLHSPMHSSQMYTVGPAISFLTSFWALPQNEQVRDAPSRFSMGIARVKAYRGVDVGTSRRPPRFRVAADTYIGRVEPRSGSGCGSRAGRTRDGVRAARGV